MTRRPNVERILLAVSIAASLVGLALVAIAGVDYYSAPTHERLYSNEHARFGSAGTIGVSCGVIALVLFASNFGYLLRKQVPALSRVGSLRYWLDWHVASGLIGCGYVALHSGLEMRNLIARAAVYALAVVIATGLAGRYLLRFVPRTATGARADLDSFEDRVLALVDDARPALVEHPEAVRAMQELVDELEDTRVAPAVPTLHSVRELRSRLARAHVRVRVVERALAHHPDGRLRARSLRVEMARVSRQAAVVQVAGRMMDTWRAFHRAFALLLLCAIVAHVGIALYYGYGAFWQ